MLTTVTMMKHGPASSVALRCVLVLAVLAAVILIVHLRGHHFHVSKLRHIIEQQGPYGHVIFLIIYLLAVVLALPESPFTALAGTLFRPEVAIVEVSLMATFGAAISFLAARYWVRDYVTRRLGANTQFNRLNELVDKHGSLVTFLIRLVPIFPSSMLNYGFGLTRVAFGTFVISTWIGMLPGIALYVMGTDLVAKGFTHGHLPWQQLTLLLAVIAVLAFCSHKAWHIVNPTPPPPPSPTE